MLNFSYTGKKEGQDISGLIEALNTALNLLDQRFKDNLKIKRFSFVPLAKYDSIINQQD